MKTNKNLATKIFCKNVANYFVAIALLLEKNIFLDVSFSPNIVV